VTEGGTLKEMFSVAGEHQLRAPGRHGAPTEAEDESNPRRTPGALRHGRGHPLSER